MSEPTSDNVKRGVLKMDELNIKIRELEDKESDLVTLMCKPTAYGKSPTDKELEEITEMGIELGKIVFALSVLRDLRDNITRNYAG